MCPAQEVHFRICVSERKWLHSKHFKLFNVTFKRVFASAIFFCFIFFHFHSLFDYSSWNDSDVCRFFFRMFVNKPEMLFFFLIFFHHSRNSILFCDKIYFPFDWVSPLIWFPSKLFPREPSISTILRTRLDFVFFNSFIHFFLRNNFRLRCCLSFYLHFPLSDNIPFWKTEKFFNTHTCWRHDEMMNEW